MRTTWHSVLLLVVVLHRCRSALRYLDLLRSAALRRSSTPNLAVDAKEMRAISKIAAAFLWWHQQPVQDDANIAAAHFAYAGMRPALGLSLVLSVACLVAWRGGLPSVARRRSCR